MSVYLGAMGWSYRYWPLYQGVSSSEYLTRYAEHFNSVEVNSTFYRIPRKSSVKNWRDQTSDGFKFSVKIPRSVSHSKNLKYDKGKLDAFLDHIGPFSNKLGAILLQLSPKTNTKNVNQLETLLAHLGDHRTAVEFRHKDWYKEPIYALLRNYNAAFVNVDHPWLPSIDIETADFTYIRLEGDRRKINGEKGVVEVDRSLNNYEWSSKIDSSRTFYLYVSKYYSGYPPKDIKDISSRLPID